MHFDAAARDVECNDEDNSLLEISHVLPFLPAILSKSIRLTILESLKMGLHCKSFAMRLIKNLLFLQ